MSDRPEQSPESEEFVKFKRVMMALMAVPKDELYILDPKMDPKHKAKKRSMKKAAGKKRS